MKYIAPFSTEPDKKLYSYIKLLKEIKKFEVPESFNNLPFDETALKQSQEMKHKMVDSELKYIFVIGIGGSNLGTKAIYDSYYGFYDTLEADRFPKIFFMDSFESRFLDRVLRFIENNVKSEHEILINVVSKSGTTTETYYNIESLLKKHRYLARRVVATTNENSILWKHATHRLPIPHSVGGRYSVFSNVGIFPLMCADINVVELLKGAMEATRISMLADKNNLAALSATATYESGKPINENFYFAPQLESLGKWHRQLMAESLGKDGKGITPTVAIGSTDLHSIAQLHLGGPKDKYFNFVSVEKDNKVKSAILHSVLQSYEKKKLPVAQTIFEDTSEKSLGFFMQFKMFETIFLGKLLGINAFDQPNVEDYKVNTKKLLKQYETA